VWALIVAPIIPIVVATVVTHWLDDSGSTKTTPTSTPAPVATITGAALGANANLRSFLDGDRTALEHHRRILGCEGWVFTVRSTIANVRGGSPQLRWSLQERGGLGNEWSVPAEFQDLRKVPVRAGTGETRVWIPAPSQRASWQASFALYTSAGDDVNHPASTRKATARLESAPLPPGETAGLCDTPIG
jgi:hypothetical protein